LTPSRTTTPRGMPISIAVCIPFPCRPRKITNARADWCSAS
jgi:hypothetical protein